MTEPIPLDLRAASQSPCLGCAAQCCTVLPVHSFELARWSDLDYARYLLNFARIELALLESGSWQVHYRAPCRHFDADRRRCRVHRQPEQPSVCRGYDAWNCAYRRIWSADGPPALRIDRGRLESWASLLQFDEQREIIGKPDFAALAAHLPALAPIDDPPVPSSAQLEARLRGEAGAPGPIRSWSALASPCAGCAAWCCTRLSFPRGPVNTAANLDHLGFCLGFDGVEAGLDRYAGWSLTLRTHCRHRVEAEGGAGRCGAYEAADRPKVCERYDGRACAYRARYATPAPRDFVRFDHRDFLQVAETFRFDGEGYAVAIPEIDDLHAIFGLHSPLSAAAEDPR